MAAKNRKPFSLFWLFICSLIILLCLTTFGQTQERQIQRKEMRVRGDVISEEEASAAVEEGEKPSTTATTKPSPPPPSAATTGNVDCRKRKKSKIGGGNSKEEVEIATQPDESQQQQQPFDEANKKERNADASEVNRKIVGKKQSKEEEAHNESKEELKKEKEVEDKKPSSIEHDEPRKMAKSVETTTEDGVGSRQDEASSTIKSSSSNQPAALEFDTFAPGFFPSSPGFSDESARTEPAITTTIAAGELKESIGIVETSSREEFMKDQTNDAMGNNDAGNNQSRYWEFERVELLNDTSNLIADNIENATLSIIPTSATNDSETSKAEDAEIFGTTVEIIEETTASVFPSTEGTPTAAEGNRQSTAFDLLTLRETEKAKEPIEEENANVMTTEMPKEETEKEQEEKKHPKDEEEEERPKSKNLKNEEKKLSSSDSLHKEFFEGANSTDISCEHESHSQEFEEKKPHNQPKKSKTLVNSTVKKPPSKEKKPAKETEFFAALDDDDKDKENRLAEKEGKEEEEEGKKDEGKRDPLEEAEGAKGPRWRILQQQRGKMAKQRKELKESAEIPVTNSSSIGIGSKPTARVTQAQVIIDRAVTTATTAGSSIILGGISNSREMTTAATQKWTPYTFDCSNEVDDRGELLCQEWARGGLCEINKATRFLFCRRTCLCVGIQSQ